MMLLAGRVFLRTELVRVRGVILGYLDDRIGIIKYYDKHGDKKLVVFHTEDAWLFRRPVGRFSAWRDPKQLLPVGLNVSLDARRVELSEDVTDELRDQLQFQAVTVLAGNWPPVPHPTLLPGGAGGSRILIIRLRLDKRIDKRLD